MLDPIGPGFATPIQGGRSMGKVGKLGEGGYGRPLVQRGIKARVRRDIFITRGKRA
jgi:hypothetical protein